MADRDGRYRAQWRYWLNYRDREERGMAQALKALKSQRKYTWFIRTAIRITLGLMAKDTSPLVEAFPWVAQALHLEPRSYYAEPPRPYTLEEEVPIQMEITADDDSTESADNLLISMTAFDGFN